LRFTDVHFFSKQDPGRIWTAVKRCRSKLSVINVFPHLRPDLVFLGGK